MTRIKKAMAAVYTEITLEEMEKFLKRSFRSMRPKQSLQRGEVCYELKLSDAVGIRVYTSIRRGSELSAKAGADLIQVQLFSLKDGGPLEGGRIQSKDKVKRTQGWRDGLKDRIEGLMDRYEEKDEFWDDWATNRQRRNQNPQKVMEQQEEERERAEDEDGEGDDGEGEASRSVPPPPPPEPSVKKQWDPSKMQGGITEPQTRFLRGLLRGVSTGEWESWGLSKITGQDEPPGFKEVSYLSKGQASQMISILTSKKNRYAADQEAAKWKA